MMTHIMTMLARDYCLNKQVPQAGTRRRHSRNGGADAHTVGRSRNQGHVSLLTAERRSRVAACTGPRRLMMMCNTMLPRD